MKAACLVLGWTLLAWTALRGANGAGAFLWVLLAFMLFMVVPAFRQLLRLSRGPAKKFRSARTPDKAAVPLLVGSLILLTVGGTSLSAAPSSKKTSGANAAPMTTKDMPFAESVTQQIRVEEKFAVATAKIKWEAEKGQALSLLFEPAVLTHVNYPTRSLRLTQRKINAREVQQLEAEEGRHVRHRGKVPGLPAGRRRIARVDFICRCRATSINRLSGSHAWRTLEARSGRAFRRKPCPSSAKRAAAARSPRSVLFSRSDEASDWLESRTNRDDEAREAGLLCGDLPTLRAAGGRCGGRALHFHPAGARRTERIGFQSAQRRGNHRRLYAKKRRSPAAYPGQTDANNATIQKRAHGYRARFGGFDPDTRKLRVTLSHPQSRPVRVGAFRSQSANRSALPFEQIRRFACRWKARRNKSVCSAWRPATKSSLMTRRRIIFRRSALKDFPGVDGSTARSADSRPHCAPRL